MILGASQFGDVPGRSGDGSAVVLVFRALRDGQSLVELLEIEAIGKDLRPLATGVGRRAVPVTVSASPNDGGPVGGGGGRRTIE